MQRTALVISQGPLGGDFYIWFDGNFLLPLLSSGEVLRRMFKFTRLIKDV